MLKVPALHWHAGLSRQEVVNASFWDTFALKTSFPLEEVQQRAALNRDFALSNVVMRNAELCMTSAVESVPPALRVFAMGFRWGLGTPAIHTAALQLSTQATANATFLGLWHALDAWQHLIALA